MVDNMSFSLSLTIKNILKDLFKLKNDKIDASRIEGTIPIESLPPASLERIKVVQNDAARLALTKATVQNGDTVKVKDTKKMYFVVDDTKLNQEDGYEEYVSGGAASAEIAERAKLALNSEKLGGLTLDALRTEVRGYSTGIQDGSIRNQHLAADFSLPTDKIADGAITNPKIGYKSITVDKIADGILTAANVNAYDKSEVDSRIDEKVNKSGDTMTGALTVPSIKINGNKGNFLSGFRMDEQDWISIINNKGLRTNASMKADGGFLGRATTAGRADSSARADNANNADRATYTEKVANGYRNMRFNWNGQNGQPPWLWGGSDGENMFVYNPSNFNVNHATTADFATKIKGNKLIFEDGVELWIE